MTTGSYSLDQFTAHAASGSWLGTKGLVAWNGADEPRATRPPPTYYLIHREVRDPKTGRISVKTWKIREAYFAPKRARKKPHAYSKTYSRLEQALTGPMLSDGRRWPDLWLANPGGWSASNLLDANHQIKLVTKLTEQLQGSDFNMSVFLGEGHQTLRMLSDTAIRLAKAGWHARKFDVTGAARALFEGTTRKPLAKHDWVRNRPGSGSAKNTANLWLELQYGWLPLLNDAEACAHSLAAYLNEPLKSTYRASVRREINDVLTTFPTGSDRCDLPRTKSHRRGLIAVVSEKPSVIQQLGLLDPELVAWELMPFSFIADWFIPIGSWMEARAKASRLTGTFITTDKQWGQAGPLKHNGKVSTPSRYRSLVFSRTISTTLDVPMPTLKPLAKVASWKHCANAVALLTQVFTGAPVRRFG